MESWLDEFRYMQKTVDWGVLTYTMHPYVIGRGYRMLALEGLVDKSGEVGRRVHDHGRGRRRGEGQVLRRHDAMRTIATAREGGAAIRTR